MNLDVTGIDELISKLESVAEDSENICRRAVYKGAAVLADEIRKGLVTMPTQEFVRKGEMRKGIRERYKQDVIDGFGISPIETSGGKTTVSVGFHGYGSYPTDTYPNGIPNQLLMRAVESGTSFMVKHPIVRPAINRARSKCKEAMELSIIDTIRKG